MKFRKKAAPIARLLFSGVLPRERREEVGACMWGFGQIEIENGNGREYLGKKTETKGGGGEVIEIEDRIKKKEGMRDGDNV